MLVFQTRAQFLNPHPPPATNALTNCGKSCYILFVEEDQRRSQEFATWGTFKVITTPLTMPMRSAKHENVRQGGPKKPKK